MVGFFGTKPEEMVAVIRHEGKNKRKVYVPKAQLDAEANGETYIPTQGRTESTPIKDWTLPEKLLAATSAALLLAGAYYGALYLAGTGAFPTEVNHFILNSHHQILEATGFADNMVQTFKALENGELDVDGAISGAAKIGETAINGTNRNAINPLLEQFSRIFAPLNVGK